MNINSLAGDYTDCLNDGNDNACLDDGLKLKPGWPCFKFAKEENADCLLAQGGNSVYCEKASKNVNLQLNSSSAATRW